MNLAQQVFVLLRKELTMEWRNRYALNGILLYVVSTVFVCYLSFKKIEPTVWNALFWIILLFASLTAISKSFIQESRGRHLYYYSIADPRAVILSKIIYNAGLQLLISLVALGVYSVIFRNEVGDLLLYFLAVVLGSISFAGVFTMISAIASRAGNNATLMAILSFPVIVPLLTLLIKLAKNAMDGLDRSVSYDDIGAVVAVNAIVIAVSLLLMPFVWRD
jgi:heme exporter protein B